MPSVTLAAEDVTQHGDGLSRIHLSNSPTDMRNCPLASSSGAGVGPSSALLPFPQCEGWRAEHACPGFRQGGPGVTGRPRARGLAHPCADTPAHSQRATRQSTAYRLLRLLDLTAPVLRRQIGPKKRQDPTKEPPGVVCFCVSHTRSRVTASRPTLITPHEAPSQWTERSQI